MTSTQFTYDISGNAADVNVLELVKNILVVLNDKEKEIIQKRFAILNNRRHTLQEIGDSFSVTRERIRQIEKNALKKLSRNAQNTNLRLINEFARNIVKKYGGAMEEQKLLDLLVKALDKVADTDKNEIRLSLTLDIDLIYSPNTLALLPYWRLKDVSTSDVRNVQKSAFSILKKSKNVHSNTDLAESVKKNLTENISAELIVSSLEVDKRFKFTESGIGLTAWRHINPKTLNDKINFILKIEGKPLHFSKISKKIVDHNFDHKKVNVQAVHNELIRSADFVLIGRGIYALREWGYAEGTVADIIEQVLTSGKAMTREEITKEVLKQRMVKTITVYLNLKNKPQFVRVGRNKYELDLGKK